MGKYSFCYYITIMITFYSSQYMAVIFKIPWLMTFSYLQTDCLTPCQHHVKAHANQLHPVWGKNTNNKRFLQGKNSHLYCLAHWCEILDCSWNALGKLMQIQKQISVSGNCYIFCYRESEFVEEGSKKSLLVRKCILRRTAPISGALLFSPL